jgi:hypothetical protein
LCNHRSSRRQGKYKQHAHNAPLSHCLRTNRDREGGIEFIGHVAEGALARLHLLGEDGVAIGSASKIVKEGMSGVLYENCAAEICKTQVS